MSELRIAILGSGYMGRTYAECISKYNSRGQLVAVAGGSRAPGLAKDYGVEHEPTFTALLARADVDAVLIATPHDDHVQQVVQAAQAHKHILVEKPMATSVAGCNTMIEACSAANVYLEVIKTMRFRGTMARAKKLIDEGKIGQVRMVRCQSLFTAYMDEEDKSWTSDPKHGGAFLDMGVHNFDALRFLAGADAASLYSQITTFERSRFPDLSAMTLVTFANGVMGHQWMSYEMPKPNVADSMQRYMVVGEKGIIDIDGYGKLMLGTGDEWETVWEQPPIDFIRRPFEPSRLEAFYSQTQSFIDDVLDGRPATVSGLDGRAAVEMVEGARRSSETGQSVTFPLK